MKSLLTAIGCFIATLTVLPATAQCRISIESPDSLPFLFSVNDLVVNQVPVLSITLDQASAGKINFKADFPSRAELNFSQVMTIKKNAFVSYSIERNKGTLKFILTGESEISFPFLDISASEQSSADAPSERHSGCFPVADDAAYQEMLLLADVQHFESKKLSILSEFASTQCIRIEQLRFMMNKLTQEDNKLALLIASKDHIFDPEQAQQLLNEFFLAKNKAKATEIIGANR
jgi:hypothetical protein